MHVRIAYPRWREKRSRHSRRMRTRNFTYLARGPLMQSRHLFPCISLRQNKSQNEQHSFRLRKGDTLESHLRCSRGNMKHPLMFPMSNNGMSVPPVSNKRTPQLLPRKSKRCAQKKPIPIQKEITFQIFWYINKVCDTGGHFWHYLSGSLSLSWFIVIHMMIGHP